MPQDIIKVGNAITAWRESGQSFLVTRVAGKITQIQSFIGRSPDDLITFNYSGGVFTGVTGNVHTTLLHLFIAEAIGAARLNDAGTALVSGDGKYVSLGARNGSRPRLLVFGNSLAGLSNRQFQGGTTTLSVAALAGATTVTVAAVGTIADGRKIAIALYDGTTFTTTVSGAPSGFVVTLSAALPRMARSGAAIGDYTTVQPSSIRRVGGPMYQAMAMLGMPVEMVQGYGYGGGTVPDIMMDLPRVMEAIRPAFVHFLDVENSMALTSDALIATVKYKCDVCASYGAVPLVNTAYPSTSYTIGHVAAYDAYNTYVLGQMLIDYPSAIAVDVSRQWLDTTAPTLRGPLAGWTDGVHPNTNKYATIGALLSTALANVVPTAKSLLKHSLSPNPELAGSGGTASGMQGGSVIPTSITYQADAGVTATSSTTSAGESRLVMTVPGTSNLSTTTFKATYRYTLPANAGGTNQALLAYVKLKIAALTGVSMLYPYLQFSGGEQYSCGQDSDLGTDPGLIGKTVQWESPISPIPAGATYVDVNFWLRPQSGLSNGVSVDIELQEMGLVPSPYITH